MSAVARRRSAERPRDRYGRPLPWGARDELPGRKERTPRPATAATTFDAAVARFDAERFFEAHEHFLHLWRWHADPQDRGFWQGVAQVATGCVHIQRGNAAGARRLLARAEHNLAGYPSPHRGVDTGALTRAARGLAARVAVEGAHPGLAFPRFPRAGEPPEPPEPSEPTGP